MITTNINVEPLALTIRRDYRLITISKLAGTSIRISSKISFLAIVLTLLNMIV